MRLGQLEYFIKIAECGSFSKAAKELYISQPTLTKSIAGLEAEYDIQLLERESKGVRLTPKGREFLGYARDVINSRYVLEQTFGQKAEHPPVQRLCVASQQFDFLYPLLEQIYKESGSAMNIHLEEVERGSVIEQVHEGISNVGILVLTEDDPRFLDLSLKKKALAVHELDTSSVYVCMSKRSPLCSKEIITGADTLPYLHVALDMDDSTRRYACQGTSHKTYADQIVFCNTIGACLHFMRHTGALLYVPKWVLGLIHAEEDMRVVPLNLKNGKPWPLVNHLVYIKRENEELSILENRFIHLLEDFFSI